MNDENNEEEEFSLETRYLLQQLRDFDAIYAMSKGLEIAAKSMEERGVQSYLSGDDKKAAWYREEAKNLKNLAVRQIRKWQATQARRAQIYAALEKIDPELVANL